MKTLINKIKWLLLKKEFFRRETMFERNAKFDKKVVKIFKKAGKWKFDEVSDYK
jgi:hypothetical protein